MPRDTDIGFLQHGHGTEGPYCTERVPIRHQFLDRWQARYMGRWRRVHIQLHRTYIVHRGERITILIEGV